MTIGIASCIDCKHFIDYWKCKAFPKRIPAEIATGMNDHVKPYTSDNGIQYEPTAKTTKKTPDKPTSGK